MNAESARRAVGIYEQIDRLLARIDLIDQRRGTAKVRALAISSPEPGVVYGGTYDIVSAQETAPTVAAKIARFVVDTQLAALRLDLKECGRTLAQLGFEKPKACE